MNRYFFNIIFTLAFLSVSSPCQVQAETMGVTYEVRGETTIYEEDDRVGDLLGIPRGTKPPVPFTCKILVDPNSLPYIELDTQQIQSYIYRTAIVSVELEINGVKFITQRKLYFDAGSNAPTPPSNGNGDESRFKIYNGISPNDIIGNPPIDFFRILIKRSGHSSDLFNKYTVPVNIIVDGTLIESADVGIASLDFRFPDLKHNIVYGPQIPKTINDMDVTPIPDGTSFSIRFQDNLSNITDYLAVHAQNSDTFTWDKENIFTLKIYDTPIIETPNSETFNWSLYLPAIIMNSK
ncbi:MAG: hypothetical protein GY702_29375 [Desulfobulbaceae bacterium]|nr:hypothetical protein [Desulfobulbaceae bacterium]